MDNERDRDPSSEWTASAIEIPVCRKPPYVAHLRVQEIDKRETEFLVHIC